MGKLANYLIAAFVGGVVGRIVDNTAITNIKEGEQESRRFLKRCSLPTMVIVTDPKNSEYKSVSLSTNLEKLTGIKYNEINDDYLDFFTRGLAHTLNTQTGEKYLTSEIPRKTPNLFRGLTPTYPKDPEPTM